MLIISKFHDYYDTALKEGVDKTCVYNRKTETNKKQIKWNRLKDENYRIRTHLIGFCGKIYPVIHVEHLNDKDEFYYSNSDFSSNCDVFSNKKHAGRYVGGARSLFGPDFSKSKDREEFYNRDYSKYEKYFQEYQCPVFIIEDIEYIWFRKEYRIHRIIKNPKLKDYNFMKVKDPYTAFQDIYMYISGVLGNKEKDTVNISDEQKKKQKGFYKWSFKKMPGEKKPRRKKNGKDNN